MEAGGCSSCSHGRPNNGFLHSFYEQDAQADVTNANAIVQHNLCENEKAGLSAQDAAAASC